jgi:BlaI family transcriptional regulator, penicillinase repressor
MAKRSQPPPLSEGQLEIMNVVWDRGEVSVADVWKTLSERRKVARNTVQTMMTRLEEKGWLKHRVEGSAFVYTAAAPRAATLRNLVQRLVDTAFSGSAEGLVLAMLEGRGLSKSEAERIRKLIREAERKEP